MANLFTIPQLLVGQNYRSNSISGEIISAEKSPQAIWYGDNTETYLVEIAPNSGFNNWGRKTFRTIAVKVGE